MNTALNEGRELNVQKLVGHVVVYCANNDIDFYKLRHAVGRDIINPVASTIKNKLRENRNTIP